ncbi:MAG: DUF1294 domain-containing protein [Oscillospiraceae bacterium]|nr:DUF1294 domain-containing protein [Oscillospiraceae bacterium]
MSLPVMLLLAYLAAVNLIGFSAMAVDKRRAKAGKWRIRERTLFLWALLGGSLGSVLGMFLCRHKTRHWYFRFGLPLILVLQLLLLAWLALGHPIPPCKIGG